ncbi:MULTISPECIES: Gfo/Idh/MocA family protein [unclassified Schlesneria]|uniref:Gfo/Idh/MocA family protein n=1 Tax=Schlesneria TaxID=656899 RepID=UPI0035A09F77
MSQRLLNRRSFLQTTAAGAAAAWAAPAVLSQETKKAELHVAAIGANGMGWADLSSVGTHPKVKFVGFCDVDSQRFDQVDKHYPGVPHFADYREMIEQLGDKLDAVIVSTPDHMHAPAAMFAMNRGKHCYCQKPLTHTVWEARQMRLLAEKKKLITQMGNQIHSNLEYRLGVRLLKEGAIGKIKAVHSWIGVNGHQHYAGTSRPPVAEVPASLNWKLWLGAASDRPYGDKAYHTFNWRAWQEFGSGALGDFGCHILDPVFSALDLTAPLSITAEHEGFNPELWPGPETVTYVFPSTPFTKGDTLKVTWYDGGRKPFRDLAQLPDGVELPGGGSLFIGEGGTMVLPHIGMPQLYPQAKFADFKRPEEKALSHWHVWVDAVLSNTPTSDGFHYSGPLTETVQLGNIAALHPGKTLEWDAKALRIKNVPEANALLTKKYTKGFEVEAVA